jgi:hypothetical protein
MTEKYDPATLKPYRRPRLQLRRTLHRWIDPLGSLPNAIRAAQKLHDLPDGEYRVPVEVPYVSQFASPDLIQRYIHDHLHGRDDPNWQSFGAQDADTYTFWAHRACAIACVKMAVDSFASAPPRSMWELVEEGLALGGYHTYDDAGTFVDMGWFYAPLVELAGRYGLQVSGKSYASILDICIAIREGWLVAPGVTPELGENGPIRLYDGHFVLVYGFVWQHRRCTHLLLHNPSGRRPELQANAKIPVERFRKAYAHRFIMYRPAK